MREKKASGKTSGQKKMHGGKTLVSEILVLSTFKGCETLPQPTPEQMTKNENLKKNSCEKKKGTGAN